MKIKLFLIGLLVVLSTTFCISQEPQAVAVDTSATQTALTEVPDSLCVTLEGERICVPTDDAQALVAITKQIIEENKEGLPTNLPGWLALIGGILFSAKGTQIVTSGKRIYSFLRVFLRKTLNIVAFVAGIASVLLTYLLGQINDAGFEWQTFLTVWGVASFIAVYIYETWVKPKEAATPAA